MRMDDVRIDFTLRDLRISKGVSQQQLAGVCQISRAKYHNVETGKRKPDVDLLYILALFYGTSMDYIYHAFYRQHVVWNNPENDLKYAMRLAKEADILYIKERMTPEKMPEHPKAIAYVKDLIADKEQL